MTSVFTWRDETGAPACVVKNGLTDKGCDNLIKELSKQTYMQGTHISDDDKVVTSPTRKSKIVWFTDLELRAAINNAVDIVNYQAGWRYDIGETEQFQFTVYEKDDHYDWHTDGQCDHWCARESSLFHGIKLEEMNLKYTPDPRLLGTVRKISVSAILNDDYEGGELLFSTIEKDATVKITNIKARKGDLVIFPSFIEHKVAPVTKGTRYSIVAWYGGPPFK